MRQIVSSEYEYAYSSRPSSNLIKLADGPSVRSPDSRYLIGCPRLGDLFFQVGEEVEGVERL